MKKNAPTLVATTLFPDPYDERCGVCFSLPDWKRLNDLPSGTKLYAIPAGYVLVETQLIRDVIEKLDVYFTQTNGVYSGGLPCAELKKQLYAALAAAKEK